MPKKCEQCGFFRLENELTDCPDCGQTLKFTMFSPTGYQMEEAVETCTMQTWTDKPTHYEHLELPLGIRISQIGAGIGIYCLISRTMMSLFLALCFVGESKIQLEQIAVAFLIIMMSFHIIGALAGGAVAGAWSVNWVPQGIGVGVGVFIMPFIMRFLLDPVGRVDFLTFIILVCITTAISVFGAFIGHKLIQPSRFVIS
jgi:hypothetical protein